MSKVKPPSDGPKAGDLVFAYGSNTSVTHLDGWCRRHGYGAALFRAVGVAELADVELAFNHYSRTRQGGALNLRRRAGNLVSGLLLEVQDGGWTALRHKEGARSGAYGEIRRHAIGAHGEAVEVRVYIASPPDERMHHRPADGYVDTVAAGYAEADIDAAPLLAAAAGTATEPNCPGIFVYGTLLRGEQRAGACADARPECVIGAAVPGLLADRGDYPALLLQGPGSAVEDWVEGEFIRCHDIGDMLGRLDGIEGAHAYGAPGGLYRRTAIDVGIGDGRVRRGWTYVQDQVGERVVPVIASGSWRAHRGRRTAAFMAIVAAHLSCEPTFFARLEIEARSMFQPIAPLPFALTIEGVARAMAAGELSERMVARASGNWAVGIPRLASTAGR